MSRRSAFAALGVAAVFVAVRPPLAAEPACEPAAVIDGDPIVAVPLSRQLTDRGIAVGAAAGPSCPRYRATVEKHGAALAVTIAAPSGESERREVSTPEIAATWIESRIRRDVSAPLLAARALPAPQQPPAAPPIAARPGPREDPGRASRPVRRSPLMLAAFADTASADDRTTWRGIGVSGCVRLGPVCIGALARFADDRDDEALGIERSTAEAYLTASAPVQLGRATLAPTAGVGFGSATTREQFSPFNPPPSDCGIDPASPEECSEVPPASFRTRGARAALGAVLSVPLAEGISIDLRVDAELAPWAHTERFRVEDPFAAPPEPGPDGMTDPSAPGERFFYELPGEPRRFLRAGIGLRLGAW